MYESGSTKQRNTPACVWAKDDTASLETTGNSLLTVLPGVLGTQLKHRPNPVFMVL